MDEILKILPPHSFVLDLGAQRGSFASELTKATAIRLDYDPSEMKGELVVRGDAARLPFKDNVFKAIVANHSLEHLENLGGALREMPRLRNLWVTDTLQSAQGTRLAQPDVG